jgi:hypothetical protein
MVPEPNINSAKEVLTKNGISIEEAMTRMKLYNNYGEVVK